MTAKSVEFRIKKGCQGSGIPSKSVPQSEAIHSDALFKVTKALWRVVNGLFLTPMACSLCCTYWLYIGFESWRIPVWSTFSSLDKQYFEIPELWRPCTLPRVYRWMNEWRGNPLKVFNDDLRRWPKDKKVRKILQSWAQDLALFLSGLDDWSLQPGDNVPGDANLIRFDWWWSWKGCITQEVTLSSRAQQWPSIRLKSRGLEETAAICLKLRH